MNECVCVCVRSWLQGGEGGGKAHALVEYSKAMPMAPSALCALHREHQAESASCERWFLLVKHTLSLT